MFQVYFNPVAYLTLPVTSPFHLNTDWTISVSEPLPCILQFDNSSDYETVCNINGLSCTSCELYTSNIYLAFKGVKSFKSFCSQAHPHAWIIVNCHQLFPFWSPRVVLSLLSIIEKTNIKHLNSGQVYNAHAAIQRNGKDMQKNPKHWPQCDYPCYINRMFLIFFNQITISIFLSRVMPKIAQCFEPTYTAAF